MRFTPTEQRLLNEMEHLPVVDAHNHLPSEEVRLREHFDALTFYRQYTRLPMFAAGLSEADFLRMHDRLFASRRGQLDCDHDDPLHA